MLLKVTKMPKRLDLSYSFPLPDSAFEQGSILAKIKASVDILTAAIQDATGAEPVVKTSIVTPGAKGKQRKVTKPAVVADKAA